MKENETKAFQSYLLKLSYSVTKGPSLVLQLPSFHQTSRWPHGVIMTIKE